MKNQLGYKNEDIPNGLEFHGPVEELMGGKIKRQFAYFTGDPDCFIYGDLNPRVQKGATSSPSLIQSIDGMGGLTSTMTVVPFKERGLPKLNVAVGGRRSLALKSLHSAGKSYKIPMFVLAGGAGCQMLYGVADNVRTIIPGSFDQACQIVNIFAQGLKTEEISDVTGIQEPTIENFASADKVCPEIKRLWRAQKISIKAAGLLYELYPGDEEMQIKTANEIIPLMDAKQQHKLLGVIAKNPGLSVQRAYQELMGRRRFITVRIPIELNPAIKKIARKANTSPDKVTIAAISFVIEHPKILEEIERRVRHTK